MSKNTYTMNSFNRTQFEKREDLTSLYTLALFVAFRVWDRLFGDYFIIGISIVVLFLLNSIYIFYLLLKFLENKSSFSKIKRKLFFLILRLLFNLTLVVIGLMFILHML